MTVKAVFRGARQAIRLMPGEVLFRAGDAGETPTFALDVMRSMSQLIRTS